MLPGWDKLQDLRKPRDGSLEAARIVDKDALDAGADQIVAARVLTIIARDRKMSLLGKLQHLTEEAQHFHEETELTLDAISEKIAEGRRKRDQASQKHHAYYDAIISGVEESTKVIERLSN